MEEGGQKKHNGKSKTLTLLLHASHWSDICLLLNHAFNNMVSIHLHSRRHSLCLSLRGTELLTDAELSRLTSDEVHSKHKQTLAPLACSGWRGHLRCRREAEGWVHLQSSVDPFIRLLSANTHPSPELDPLHYHSYSHSASAADQWQVYFGCVHTEFILRHDFYFE